MLIIFMLLILISCTNTKPNIKYTWLERNEKYDAIVGISAVDIPVCTGVLVNRYSVMTSANAIYIHVKRYYAGAPDLYVHAINGAYDRSIVHIVEDVTYQSRRGSYFKPFGFDNCHSPVHDIAILSLEKPMRTITETVYIPRPRWWGDTTKAKIVRFPLRHFTMKPVINVEKFDDNGIFSIAGHGFINEAHVKRNIDLKVVHFQVNSVLQNCEEWVPRGWGYFICLSNVDDFVGVNAGGALFYNNRFIAIGAFSLVKGNEKLLLFTDLRKYSAMKGYRGYVDNLSDNTSASFNPDTVTPHENWWYFDLPEARGAEFIPGHPVTKQPRPDSFYY